jgi:hypothetical protein
MGVDLEHAGSGLGRRAPAEGGEAAKAAGGQTSDQLAFDAVPGRHQDRQEGRAKGIDQHRPALRQLGLDQGDLAPAQLTGLGAGGGMVAVGKAVLQHAHMGACRDPGLGLGLEPGRHHRQGHRQPAPQRQVQQAVELRVVAAGIVVAPPDPDRLAVLGDRVERLETIIL